ncbi:MAG TPA: hypothetical protein VGS23_05935, partial [Thermoplasmata archaeon]|nr:hypothetical protein [Thermoplasmata archaeon]
YNFTQTSLTQSAPAGFASHFSLTKPPASACSATSNARYPLTVHFNKLASFKLIYAEVRVVVGVGTE